MDLPELILKKVLRIAIRHLHLYLEVKRKGQWPQQLSYLVSRGFCFFANSSLICYRILIKHAIYFSARKGLDLEQQTLDDYGTHLHVALQNRKSELEYLRSVVDKLFPYALPRHSLKCR